MRRKRPNVIVVLASLLFVIAAGCQPQFQPGTFTDDMGRAVTIDTIPQRIVSHVPPITETLFALGLGDRVAGVSDYCDFPEDAKLKPSIGDYFNPSIENIVALDPDLVLTDGHSENINQLGELDPPIPFIVVDPTDVDGIFQSIELVGKVTGVERDARRLIDAMGKSMSEVVSVVKGAPRARVLYVIDASDLSSTWTAGPGSFVDALITMAGGENIAARAPSSWVQLSIEEIVSADPEIIILPAKHGTAFTLPEVLKEHLVWREITAVKQGGVYIIEGDLVDGYGPRIVQGLEEIARIIHPELFE